VNRIISRILTVEMSVFCEIRVHTALQFPHCLLTIIPYTDMIIVVLTSFYRD
jgi:hypothetical protein